MTKNNAIRYGGWFTMLVFHALLLCSEVRQHAAPPQPDAVAPASVPIEVFGGVIFIMWGSLASRHTANELSRDM